MPLEREARRTNGDKEMSKYLTPTSLQSIERVREMLSGMDDRNPLCTYVSLVDCAVPCRRCLLNFRNTPRESQLKDKAIQLLLDNKSITKGRL